MKSLRTILSATATAALLLSLARCANPGTPTGGPKDVRPPVLLSSIPRQGETGWGGRQVVITFDENVQLKDADKKFVMSPPTMKKPKVEAHGKQIKVTFDEDLLPSTTYTLDFADCLSDLNEGNIKQGFTFSFSTGESTDTMMISGNVYDAATLKPVDAIYVLLQPNLADSAFRTTVPARIAKTDVDGRFAIKNIPADADYDVFALDDQNRNFIFDQPGEKVAWLGRHVRPSFEIRQVPDSVRTDSAYMDGDSVRYVYNHIMRDTLTLTPDSLVLFAYNEDSYEQYIAKDERKLRNKVTLILNKPMPRRPGLWFVDWGKAEDFAAVQYSPTNDTVNMWMIDSTLWNKDSVVIAMEYLVKDSIGNMVSKTDTLREWHKEKPKTENKRERRRKKQTDDKPKIPSLDVKVSQNLGPFSVLSISSPTPFDSLDWQAVRLGHKVDTIFQDVPYSIEPDSSNICSRRIKHKWILGDTYRLTIDSAAIKDIYGVANRPIKQEVKVATADRYGTIYIDVDSVGENDLVQIVTGNGVPTRQNYAGKSGKVGFKYVKPGDYFIRILDDRNRNGKWDTGDFDSRRQPETYIYYMEKVKVKANWDIHIEFRKSDFTPDRFYRKLGDKKNNKRR